jgi:hypothetical protein
MNFEAFRLTPAEREELLAAQHECTISWNNADGWPVAVIQTYVWQRSSIWVTAFNDKPRVGRLRADGRAAVAVSSSGTSLPADRMASARVMAAVHDDPAVAEWFYPAFAAIAAGPDERAQQGFVKALTRQDRSVIELRPVSWTSFDGGLLRTGGRPKSS